MDAYDCIVVGAGLAGLQAATKLAERGNTVLVLEARDVRPPLIDLRSPFSIY